jgi:TonB family protein
MTQLKPANPMGDVVLEFSISPAGRVRDCKVVSSTIKDRGFAQAVATLVKQTEFAPKNVGVTLVKDFHISFAPLPVG